MRNKFLIIPCWYLFKGNFGRYISAVESPSNVHHIYVLAMRTFCASLSFAKT